ncbi:hypothetical protein NXC24_PB00444 (plasmid) [Rhizobium sp. NXC24]|nr:hypothetical protein NXC24_PB00444 [Rhizobium sp. NXC24]
MEKLIVRITLIYVTDNSAGSFGLMVEIRLRIRTRHRRTKPMFILTWIHAHFAKGSKSRQYLKNLPHGLRRMQKAGPKP